MPASVLRLFPGITKDNHEPNVMLELAKNAELEEVVILGFDKSGDIFFSANVNDGGAVLWLIEKAKLMLLQQEHDGAA